MRRGRLVPWLPVLGRNVPGETNLNSWAIWGWFPYKNHDSSDIQYIIYPDIFDITWFPIINQCAMISMCVSTCKCACFYECRTAYTAQDTFRTDLGESYLFQIRKNEVAALTNYHFWWGSEVTTISCPEDLFFFNCHLVAELLVAPWLPISWVEYDTTIDNCIVSSIHHWIVDNGSVLWLLLPIMDNYLLIWLSSTKHNG